MSRIRVGASHRIVLLDELRGLSLVLMIVYHGLYDLVHLFSVDIPFYSAPFQAMQLFICCTFICVSGISSRFSRSNLRRGAIVFLCGMLMTAGTWIAMRDQLIVFGILHMLGICMMLHGLIFRPGRMERISSFGGIVICLLLFAVTWGVSGGYIGFLGLVRIPLPDALYRYYLLSPLGLRSPGFRSADYFPILPWVFLFFAGSFLGTAFRMSGAPGFFYRSHLPALAAAGRHTMPIYLLHQPVLYGLLWLVFFAMRSAGL